MKIVFRWAALRMGMRKMGAGLMAGLATVLLGLAIHAAVVPAYLGNAAEQMRHADRAGFRRAAELTPHNAAPWMALGLLSESEGRFPQAERELLHAVRLDRGYLPRWTLATYYLRHENAAAWPLIEEALRIAVHGGQNPSALFETCWQFHPQGQFLLGHVVGSDPDTLRLYLKFLLVTGRTNALREAALLLPRSADPLMLRTADALLNSGDVAGAKQIWDRAVPAADKGELLTNNRFRQPRQLGFDWRYNDLPESRISFGDSLRMECTGRQPDPLETLFQFVPLPAGSYRLAWQLESTGTPGLFWQATDARSGGLLFRRLVRTGAEFELFPVRADGLIRLALRLERLPGASRFEGLVNLRNLSLKAVK
jgi:tetratricopeptide (TPR) repeat protein